jgi:hypothetical protein
MPRTLTLSDLQRVFLAHAAKRDGRHVLPLPVIGPYRVVRFDC